MKYLFSLIAFLITINISAQEKKLTKQQKKAEALYTEAVTAIQANNDFRTAAAKFQQAIACDSSMANAYLSLGGVYSELKKYDSSLYYYKRGLELDTAKNEFYRLPYSISLAGVGNFDEANHQIDLMLSDSTKLIPSEIKAARYRQRNYQFAIDYQKSNPDNYTINPINLGDSINSTYSEYLPCLTIDGKKIVFTRNVDGNNEDFYQADKQNNIWSRAIPLSNNINTPYNEGAENISLDGKWIVYTGCNRPDGWGSCDIYISMLTDDGWTVPTNLSSRVNTKFWESQPCLSPDKKDLYFSSNRYGGYGGCDIYVTHLSKNGRWSFPENLGPSVNSAGDETCPMIHADNQTLYFSSNGLPGYGDTDFFMSHKTEDGKWTTPKNLGYPINTIDHEGSLFISSDSEQAYFASNRSDSRGGLDIYSFHLRKNVRPAKTLWVTGKVYDEKTKIGLPSFVELHNIETLQTIANLQTDGAGNYLCTLPVGNDYVFQVNRKGYLFFNKNISLKNPQSDSSFVMDIPLQPIEKNATLVLRNILFNTNEFVLLPSSMIELTKLVELMQENMGLNILVIGHTDSIGKKQDNALLSSNRAKAVVDYLIANGIDARRMKFKGMGDTMPIATNTTEEGRAMNRRTEIKVLGVDGN